MTGENLLDEDRALAETWDDEIAPYDAADDMWRSYRDCLAVVRERVAAGGKTWKPK